MDPLGEAMRSWVGTSNSSLRTKVRENFRAQNKATSIVWKLGRGKKGKELSRNRSRGTQYFVYGAKKNEILKHPSNDWTG